MMADHDERDAVELASAYLDDEVTADERARVESDPVLMAHVERLRQVRAAVADVPPAPPETRDAAIAAALAAFDEIHDAAAPSVLQPSAPANVVPLERRRQLRLMQALTAVAAAGVLVIGGFVIANRGGDDDATTADQQPAQATAQSESAALEATPSSAPLAAAAPTTTIAANRDAEDTAGELEAADAPLAAAPTETAASSPAIDAAGAPAAASVVLRDAADLQALAESLDDELPSESEVVADCERQAQALAPDAVFEGDAGTVTPVAVARTADGFAAVSLDDCTIVLRSPPDAGGAEG